MECLQFLLVPLLFISLIKNNNSTSLPGNQLPSNQTTPLQDVASQPSLASTTVQEFQPIPVTPTGPPDIAIVSEESLLGASQQQNATTAGGHNLVTMDPQAVTLAPRVPDNINITGGSGKPPVDTSATQSVTNNVNSINETENGNESITTTSPVQPTNNSSQPIDSNTEQNNTDQLADNAAQSVDESLKQNKTEQPLDRIDQPVDKGTNQTKIDQGNEPSDTQLVSDGTETNNKTEVKRDTYDQRVTTGKYESTYSTTTQKPSTKKYMSTYTTAFTTQCHIPQTKTYTLCSCNITTQPPDEILPTPPTEVHHL